MIFDKYKKLSEDSQWFLCCFVEIGFFSGIDMREYIKMQKDDCFPYFDSEKAMEELVRMSIISCGEEDWINDEDNSLGITTYDIAPALWYLYEERKDILISLWTALEKRKDLLCILQKHQQEIHPEYAAIRNAIKQLVDSDFSTCSNACVIKKYMADLLRPLVLDKRSFPLISNLPQDTFTELFNYVTNMLLNADIAIDTLQMRTMVMEYVGITETVRRQILAKMALYDYIANGILPKESAGEFINTIAGNNLMGIYHICRGDASEAAKWFDLALTFGRERTAMTDFLYRLSPIECLYVVIAYISVVNGKTNNNEKMAAEYNSRLRDIVRKIIPETFEAQGTIPALILAENFFKPKPIRHPRLIRMLYEDMERNRVFSYIYPHMAFLIANHLGYSTSHMDASHHKPNLALLRYEMSRFIPLDEEELTRLRGIYGDQPPLAIIQNEQIS